MISLKESEIAELILKSDDVYKLLENEEILEKLNDSIFEKFLMRYMRALVLASIPRIIQKLIQNALEGNTSATKLLIELYNKNLEKGEEEALDILKLENKVKELLREYESR